MHSCVFCFGWGFSIGVFGVHPVPDSATRALRIRIHPAFFMNSINLVERFQLYSSWRFALAQSIERFRDWAAETGLSDPQGEARVARVLEHLANDKLSIAFVAEFSRGKSELINAIFFAGYGRRILPSSAGRTTMCPTELMYEEGQPPALRLLPIESRSSAASVSEFKQYPGEWVIYPLDTTSSESMHETFKHVSEVKRVPVEVAQSYGLFDPNDPDHSAGIDVAGAVEIPNWRHAVINFPHPLLTQGLVILDTPGLNAIGSEPELTLNLIPNAHAVLFVLGADTGVTKSDIQIWRDHIGVGEGGGRARLVVLNKIDSQWDDLKSEREIDAEIARQAASVARALGLPATQIFPISAQKGLVAKVQGDARLLARSRLLQLEEALSLDLIPAKQQIVRDLVSAEMDGAIRAAQALTATRANSLREQLAELEQLAGKNEGMMQQMLDKVVVEKQTFDKGLLQFSISRNLMTERYNMLFSQLGMDAYREQVKKTHEAMQAAKFSAGVLDAMRHFFAHSRETLGRADAVVADITHLTGAMYKKFSAEFGMRLAPAAPYSMLRYLKELERVEESFKKRFGALSMITSYEKTLTRQFFSVIAARIQQAFVIANRDAEGWIKAIMNPLEAQVKERQQQLRRRLDSVKRIHLATDTLSARLSELSQAETAMMQQVLFLDNLRQEIDVMLAQDMTADLAGPSAGFDVSL